jgi:NAD(P)-dependent dehydrogenase (short-subunit alcohol dehydrogenase family)
MRNRLEYGGRRVLVTGVASGMGAATARLVLELGAHVVGLDLRAPAMGLEEYVEIDLRDLSAIEEAIVSIGRRGPIDAVFSCAGLPGLAFPDEDVMSVNYLAMRRVAESCVPFMNAGAAIVNVASGAGMGYLGVMESIRRLVAIEEPDDVIRWTREQKGVPGFDAYVVSKQAAIVYTLSRAPSLAAESGIRINCVSPGVTETPMLRHFETTLGKDFMESIPQPLGRRSTVEEQAWPMAFLCSDAASYVTGANLFVDGGTAGGVLTGAIDPRQLAPREDVAIA